MDWKKLLILVLFFLAVLVGGYFAIKADPLKFFSTLIEYMNCKNQTPPVVVRHDTTVIERYDTIYVEVKDPVFIDRIIHRYVSADSVVTQKVDSVFIDRVKYFDLMLSVKKAKDKVTIFAYNERDSLIKQYEFSGIGNNFTAVSDTDNILMRTNNFEWNGLSLALGGSFRVNRDLMKTQLMDGVYEPGLKTGYTAFNRLSIDAGIYNEFGNFKPRLEPKIKFELNYKIIN